MDLPDFCSAQCRSLESLEIEPELRAGAEKMPEAESGVVSDGAHASEFA